MPATPFKDEYIDFPFRKDFYNLANEEYEEAKEMVSTMWSGVAELWQTLPPELRQAKRKKCFALLVAWYLADIYPDKLLNGSSDGGRPILSKSIQNIMVTFKTLNLPKEYEVLSSNQYGIKAAYMLRSAPEMMGIYGGN